MIWVERKGSLKGSIFKLKLTVHILKWTWRLFMLNYIDNNEDMRKVVNRANPVHGHFPENCEHFL
jgi:hypothetical protein